MIPVPEGAQRIVKTLRERGYTALLAGGCVRDRLMGIPPEDWDVATDAPVEEVRGMFARTFAVGVRFGVVRVLLDDGDYEVARFRREDAYLDGRRPSAVHPASPEEDARRRDFTINGMFLDPLEDRLIDFVGGERDIEARLIRAIGEPAERFGEDHLRMLRAVRFAARFGFAIDPATHAAIRQSAARIGHTSAERIRDELNRILTEGGARRGFELLMETGLLREVLPEVAEMKGVEQPPEFHPEGDVWTHTLMVLGLMDRPAPAFAWAALLHDVGKPRTFKVDERIRFDGHEEEGARMAEVIGRRLRLPNRTVETVRSLVAHHMRFLHVRQMRRSRLKRFLREPFFPDLLELHRIDCLACHGNLEAYEFCREKRAELEAEELRPPRLLDGHRLREMGYPPGPLFREILSAVEDEQLEGRLSSREEAERFVERTFGRRKAERADPDV